MEPEKVKVCDFGYAVAFGTQEQTNLLLRSYCGTPGCMAPEVVIAGETGDGYDCKADVYSLGCITHILLTGELP